MSDLYEQMAAQWWQGLDVERRKRWLDAAEFDGRERHPVAAFTLMGDIQAGAPVLYVYPTRTREIGGQVVDGGKPVCGLHARTEAGLMETAEELGYGNIPRVRVGSLGNVPGFEAYSRDRRARAEVWGVQAREAADRYERMTEQRQHATHKTTKDEQAKPQRQVIDFDR
jgi:hypothetical protein